MSKRIERFHDCEATVEINEQWVQLEVVAPKAGLTARLQLTHQEAWNLADSLHACLEYLKIGKVKVGDWVTYLPNGARLLVDAIDADGTYVLVPSKDSEVACTATAYEIQLLMAAASADEGEAATEAPAVPTVDSDTRLRVAVKHYLDAMELLAVLEKQWNTSAWTKRTIGLHERIEAARSEVTATANALGYLLPIPQGVVLLDTRPRGPYPVTVNGRLYRVTATPVVRLDGQRFAIDITPSDESATP